LNLFENFTVFHYKPDIFERLDFVERIIADGDNIGAHFGLQRAANFFNSQQLGGICG
jgi:hypothetical protein